MQQPLSGRVALVAGATRGAGCGIAVELGAAGATAYITGRSTRERRSEYDRPETIEETAELVTQAGGLLIEMTDGTAVYNATHCWVSHFYDLTKASVLRMAWSLAHELGPRGATALALTPGWLRSEMMLTHYGVSEETWREATLREPHFVISEAPRYVGRAVAALAADPEVARWNGQSLSSGQLAQVYGFTDLDGSQPDAWRYVVEVQDAGRPADASGYR
jgi:NAD(P)-dependent dehydrogenase (short-subunit alcohol dehydrogenase family)